MPPRLSSNTVLRLSLVSTCSRPRSIANSRTLVTTLNVRPPRPRRGTACLDSRAGSSRAFHASSSHSAPKDPYKVLSIKKDASAADIKKTYFALARKYHPDTNPDKNAQEKFVEIQEAYDILKDEKKRAEYDKYGAASQQPGFDAHAYENARSGFGGSSFGFGFQDFPGSFGGARGRSSGRAGGDLFEQLFRNFTEGSGRGSTSFGRGADIEATIGISFTEACKGTTRTVNVSPVVPCDTCSGSGLKAGASRSTCSECHGTGTMSYIINSGFHMQTTCSQCQGTGSYVPPSSQCGTCAGVGHVKTRKTVEVQIPAGVEDGMALKVPNQGDAALSGNGRPGDLLVRVNVASSRTFRRQGAHLYHDVRIPVHTAILGGKVRVPTLDGELDVRVPSGTQPGEQMVLKGHGIRRINNNNKGDMFVTFNVQLPRALTTRQRELLQQYADDVEGRATTNASRQETRQEPPRDASTDGATGPRKQASTESDGPAANGTASSTSAPPKGWVSRTLGGVRRLIGF
ncbi:hypothetical protein C8Q80DRAFT_1132999 [Daedaleopsis nitida]|nr:hypothetical protein C8Q80DRAFT_1132999 [Daedaleopsis nitida]